MIRPRQEEIKMTKGKLFKIASLGLIVASVLSLVVALPTVGPAEAA